MNHPIVIATTLVFATSALHGCAVSKQTYLPDGSVGHTIRCDGMHLSIADCYEKAGELCGANGYDVFTGDRESNSFAFSAGSGNLVGNPYAISGRSGYTSYAGSAVKRSLFIKCKKPGSISVSTVPTSPTPPPEPQRDMPTETPQAIQAAPEELVKSKVYDSHNRNLGEFSHTVERLAADQGCVIDGIAELIVDDKFYQVYRQKCRNGESLVFQCELSNCQQLRR